MLSAPQGMECENKCGRDIEEYGCPNPRYKRVVTVKAKEEILGAEAVMCWKVEFFEEF